MLSLEDKTISLLYSTYADATCFPLSTKGNAEFLEGSKFDGLLRDFPWGKSFCKTSRSRGDPVLDVDAGLFWSTKVGVVARQKVASSFVIPYLPVSFFERGAPVDIFNCIFQHWLRTPHTFDHAFITQRLQS